MVVLIAAQSYGFTPGLVFIYYVAVLSGKYNIFADGWKDFITGEDEMGADRRQAIFVAFSF